ncbi:MAG TPA: transcription elongation factor GreA [Longimicrobiales bacterium]
MLEEIKAKISDELERLGHELNVTLPQAIRKAVELGDLRENAEYHSALERQKFVQARINHLTQRMIELSKIDVKAIPKDRVGFGSKLRVRNLDTGDESTYTIVAGDYMDIDAGHISMASPLGRGLLGARVDEEVVITLPGGERRFRVLELTTLPEMLE